MSSSSFAPLGKLLSSLDQMYPTNSNSSSNNNMIASCAAAAVLLLVTAVATNQRIYERLLFPGVVPDKKYKKTHALPPGDISGCPYFGSLGFLPNMNH